MCAGQDVWENGGDHLSKLLLAKACIPFLCLGPCMREAAAATAARGISDFVYFGVTLLGVTLRGLWVTLLGVTLRELWQR